MTASLETVLAEVGLRVDAKEFLELVALAVRKVSPPHTRPAEYFTPEQRAVLSEVGLDLSDYRDRELDPRARAVATEAVLVDTALTVPEAARMLGVDTSRIRHRLKDGNLAGWKNQGWRLPAWQFASNGVLPGLDVVLRALPDDQPPLVVAAFMNTPQPDLEINRTTVTPREWLLALGDPTPVAALATTLGTAA